MLKYRQKSHHKYIVRIPIHKNSPKCIARGCDNYSTHGLRGGSPIACVIHKLDDYVDVMHQLCGQEGCDKLGLNDYKGYCKEHFVIKDR